MSLACLGLWFKALYFYRVFQWSGFLIRMVFLSIWDIRIFGAIFLLVIMAFGNSFYLLGRQINPNPTIIETAARCLGGSVEPKTSRCLGGEVVEAAVSDEPLPDPLFPNYFQAVMYTYKAALGDWDTDGFGENNNSNVMLWFNWILVTSFAMIVLLNVLIAIVSETFFRVNETAKENSFREKAIIIRDLQNASYTESDNHQRFMLVTFDPFLRDDKVADDPIDA